MLKKHHLILHFLPSPGRPRELSSLSLSTWSLLTTSIREYQRGQRQYAAKVYLRMILPVYIVWVVSLFVDIGLESPAFFIMGYLFLIIMIGVSFFVAAHYRQQQVNEVFHPAVSTVIEELTPQLTATGYEVVYMVDPGSGCRQPAKAFLRFTPIPDEERRAAAEQATEQ